MGQVQSVLIVEDDVPMRDMMATVLRESGIQVTSVDSVDVAIEALKGGGFDAVLSDVRAPGKDGFELLRLIRKLELTTPVILITAFEDTVARERARDAGAASCLSKPFGLEELAAALERAAAGSM